MSGLSSAASPATLSDVLEPVRACPENRAAEAATAAAPMMTIAFWVSVSVNIALVAWIFVAAGDRDSARQDLEDERSQNRLLRQELAVRVRRR